MAAHRIIRVTNNNHILPRCKSEGTLIDLSEGVTGASLNDVKGQTTNKLWSFNSSSLTVKLLSRVVESAFITSPALSPHWLHFITALLTCSIYANEQD